MLFICKKRKLLQIINRDTRKINEPLNYATLAVTKRTTASRRSFVSYINQILMTQYPVRAYNDVTVISDLPRSKRIVTWVPKCRSHMFGDETSTCSDLDNSLTSNHQSRVVNPEFRSNAICTANENRLISDNLILNTI